MTPIADIAYKHPSGGYRKFGVLFYSRATKKNTKPSAKLRLDFIPAVAWKQDPDTWYIGNFHPCHKHPTAPFVDGDLYVPSDIKGERTKIGHIHTRERDDGSGTQYYLQLFGVPLRPIVKGIRRSYTQAIESILSSGKFELVKFVTQVGEILNNKKSSLFIEIELE